MVKSCFVETVDSCKYCNFSKSLSKKSCHSCEIIWIDFWSEIRNSFNHKELKNSGNHHQFLKSMKIYCCKNLNKLQSCNKNKNRFNRIIARFLETSNQFLLPTKLNEEFFMLKDFEQNFFREDFRKTVIFENMKKKPLTGEKLAGHLVEIESPVQFRLLNLFYLVKCQYSILISTRSNDKYTNFNSTLDENLIKINSTKTWKIDVKNWRDHDQKTKKLSTLNIGGDYSVENDLTYNQTIKMFELLQSNIIGHTTYFSEVSRTFSRMIASRGIELLNHTNHRSLMYLLELFLQSAIIQLPGLSTENLSEFNLIPLDSLEIMHHVSRSLITIEMLVRKIVFGVDTKRDSKVFEGQGYFESSPNYGRIAEKLANYARTNKISPEIAIKLQSLISRVQRFQKKFFQINYLTCYDKEYKRFYVNRQYYFSLEDIEIQCNLVHGRIKSQIFLSKLMEIVVNISDLKPFDFHIFIYAISHKIWKECFSLVQDFKLIMEDFKSEIEAEVFLTNQNFMVQFDNMMDCFYHSFGVNDLANRVILVMDEVVEMKIFFAAVDSGVEYNKN